MFCRCFETPNCAILNSRRGGTSPRQRTWIQREIIFGIFMSQHWLGVSLDVTAQRTPFLSFDPPQCRRSRAPSGPPHRSTPRRPPPPSVWDCQMDKHIPPRNMLYWYRHGFFGTVCHCHRAVVSKSLGTENRHCCRLCDTNYIVSLYSSKFIIYLPPLCISVLSWLSCNECGVFRIRWFWRKVWGIGAHKKVNDIKCASNKFYVFVLPAQKQFEIRWNISG